MGVELRILLTSPLSNLGDRFPLVQEMSSTLELCLPLLLQALRVWPFLLFVVCS